MTHSTTDTTTTRACSGPHRPEAHQRACLGCPHIDLSDTVARRDDVGWCMFYKQYRSLRVVRVCKERSKQ